VVPRTQLDQFVPVYQFREYHSTRIPAQPVEIFDAIKSVTADDIFLFRGLTWIRRFGRRGPASILNPPANQPLLDVATNTSFVLLANQLNHEIVVGTVVIAPRRWRLSERPTPQEFKSLRAPGFALAAMNFLIQRESAAVHVLSTETRIFATNASADCGSQPTGSRYIPEALCFAVCGSAPLRSARKAKPLPVQVVNPPREWIVDSSGKTACALALNYPLSTIV